MQELSAFSRLYDVYCVGGLINESEDLCVRTDAAKLVHSFAYLKMISLVSHSSEVALTTSTD